LLRSGEKVGRSAARMRGTLAPHSAVLRDNTAPSSVLLRRPPSPSKGEGEKLSFFIARSTSAQCATAAGPPPPAPSFPRHSPAADTPGTTRRPPPRPPISTPARLHLGAQTGWGRRAGRTAAAAHRRCGDAE